MSDLKLLNDKPKLSKAVLAAVFSMKSLLFIFVFFGSAKSKICNLFNTNSHVIYHRNCVHFIEIINKDIS